MAGARGARAKQAKAERRTEAKSVSEGYYWQIQERMAKGKKLTAAELDFVKTFEGERAAKATAAQAAKAGGVEKPEDSMPENFEDRVREWVVRGGVVGGKVRRMSELSRNGRLDQVKRKIIEIKRELLKEYAFDVPGAGKELSGAEAQAFQLITSITQLEAVSQEWQLQLWGMRDDRARGGLVDPETFQMIVQTVRDITGKRDGLMIKIRELAAKEKKAGTGRGQKALSFEIVMNDD